MGFEMRPDHELEDVIQLQDTCSRLRELLDLKIMGWRLPQSNWTTGGVASKTI